MSLDRNRIALAVNLFHQNKISEAASLFQSILSKNPNNYDAAHYFGVLKAAQGDFKEAARLIRSSLKQKHTFVNYCENYVAILFRSGEYKEAAEICTKTINANGATETFLYVLGCSLAKQEKYADAIRAFDDLLAQYSKNAFAYNDKGHALSKLGRHEEALIDISKALELSPNLGDAWLNKGNALTKLSRFDEAAACYKNAVQLNPSLFFAHLGLGNVFCNLRRYDEAFAAYDKALSIKPDLAEAWVGRGNVSHALKRYHEAFVAYDKALSIKPDLAGAWVGRGNISGELELYDQASASYAKAIEIDPLCLFAKGYYLRSKMYMCDWNGIEKLIAEINDDIASNRRSAEPFGYQAVAKSALNFKRCAEMYAADRFPEQPPIWQGERYKNPKIRVGYLSGEFRSQVVAKLMIGLFELHDKTRFELFAFDNGWDDGSEVRRRINGTFDTIVNIRHLDGIKAASLVKQKQIDVLVNLNGYFGEQRTDVFSYKPSPIQVSYLGFSATMGASYIDYIIGDKYIIPPDKRDFYTERVVYLPNSYQVNDSKRPKADHAPTRAELKLPNSGFVFCCFNNNFKITPEIFDAWMRILRHVQNSVLWLFESNSSVSRNLRAEARYRGVDPERLVFSPRTKEDADYLARYLVADLFLDTLPFNAGSTASDALWSGLPLLTCSGETYTARMAGSLLSAIGLPELITTSIDAYEQMAIYLANHPEHLANIKQRLVRNCFKLFDTELFTKQIEAAYISMYERYQAGLPLDHIEIRSIR